MAKFSRQGGALLIAILSSIIAGHVASAQTAALPAGWAHADIGNPLVAGNATSNGGTIAVTGAGTDVGGKADEFHYAYLPVSGDVEVRVRVASLQNVDPGAKAGLMIRESLTDTARHAFMFVSAGQGVGFVRRTRAGRPSTQTSAAAVAAPVWLRLVRKGNLFTAYSSDTGASWTQLGSDTISMAADVYVGLAVTSHQPSLTATASFTGLAFGAAAPLPAPWLAGEIGSQTPSGAASLASGVFTVTGGGPDIAGTSDQFEFVYQPITGDTQIVAWVANLQAADGWSKAGVMIRGGLTASAPHASLFATGANGWTFQRRLADAGISYSSAGSAGAVPGWVRVVREGNLFSAYQSQDGSQWVLVGTDTIVMPATVFVGLAVTSHTTAATATATFSNVTAGASTTTNKPPTVSISTPATGASFQAPATIAMAATAGDVDGSVARVDFYAGTQLVGSATTSPFTATWSNVPAGSYSLSAVATDNAGDKTTSQTVAVTVNGTTNKAPTVSVTSPSAGSTYTAPATLTINANAADSDGTVARVDFYASGQLVGSATGKPYRATWTNAAAGSYSLTAVATDNAGATAMSQPVAVTVSGPVNQPPTVALTAPATGATYTPPATITLTANAADKDGTVARVDFYAGTQLVGSDTSSPYAVTWSSVAIGSYSLTAVATDNTGARTTSQAIAVTVANNKPPTVSLTAPGSGASYMAPVNLILSGAASDPDGTVARVDFYAGTQLVGSDASAPYSVTWNNVPAGTFSLSAVATDNAGMTGASLPVNVTVAANRPPTVSISTPTTGASFTAPASLAISATAADTDGSIARVAFYAGTQLVGSSTTSPYAITWNNVAAGSYALTAVATDNVGQATTSPAVNVTVAPASLTPTTLVFVPPVDYATDVTSNTVELRRSVDAMTAAPVAMKNLGMPAVINGQISVDISSIVDPLPAGSYYAVVVTIGPGGSTSSSPSPSFDR